ncbi:hypothetical protein [uncultured Chryseobacterium sp.]|nr:hypothetical protein [uncultured Chryseobacterium sp.]
MKIENVCSNLKDEDYQNIIKELSKSSDENAKKIAEKMSSIRQNIQPE